MCIYIVRCDTLMSKGSELLQVHTTNYKYVLTYLAKCQKWPRSSPYVWVMGYTWSQGDEIIPGPQTMSNGAGELDLELAIEEAAISRLNHRNLTQDLGQGDLHAIDKNIAVSVGSILDALQHVKQAGSPWGFFSFLGTREWLVNQLSRGSWFLFSFRW